MKKQTIREIWKIKGRILVLLQWIKMIDMNGFIKVICAVLLVFFAVSCKREQSCPSMDYIYILPPEIYQDAAYIKVYANEDAFVSGEEAIEPIESAAGLHLIIPKQSYIIPFLDVRYADGTNSWSDQANLAQLSQTGVSSANCETTMRFTDYTSLRNGIHSSPIYMHLALSDPTVDGGQKGWLIDSIYDKDGTDVSERPEWQCVKKIGFTFFKGGKGAKVKITRATGGGICGMYDELFGNKEEVFATYSLEGGSQKELRITVPAASDALNVLMTFSVLESNYNHLKISITNGDTQIGYAILTPLDHE